MKQKTYDEWRELGYQVRKGERATGTCPKTGKRTFSVIPLAERLLTTQSPQRPQVSPAFSIEIDGRVYTGRAGQTILEALVTAGVRF